MALNFTSLILILSIVHNALAAVPRNSTWQSHAKRDASYHLVDKFAGHSFFDNWDFWDAPDPTHGQVNFLSRSEAMNKKLAYVQGDGAVVLAVDDYTWLGHGQKRNSVRVQSKKTYNEGLFILDAWTMPHGCSVWPAWWTVGPNWPHGGEIDIVEGVHEGTHNQYTLHTRSGCTLDRSPPSHHRTPFTANIVGTTCASGQGHNNGCAFVDNKSNSYGHGFNMLAGGVFAMLWNSDGISIWHFPRGTIPSDIEAMAPNPSSWGSPAAFWSSSTCTTKHFFQDHAMVIDTTICGDWAGATFGSAGCPGTCESYVKDPKHFEFAKWKINYIATYEAS